MRIQSFRFYREQQWKNKGKRIRLVYVFMYTYTKYHKERNLSSRVACGFKSITYRLCYDPCVYLIPRALNLLRHGQRSNDHLTNMFDFAIRALPRLTIFACVVIPDGRFLAFTEFFLTFAMALIADLSYALRMLRFSRPAWPYRLHSGLTHARLSRGGCVISIIFKRSS
jgi:hypothetical protein